MKNVIIPNRSKANCSVTWYSRLVSLLALTTTLFLGQLGAAHASSDITISDTPPLWSVDVRLWELEPFVRGEILTTIDYLVGSIFHKKQTIADEQSALLMELEEHVFDIDIAVEKDAAALRRRLRELSEQDDFLNARLLSLRTVKNEIIASFGIEA